MADFDVVVAGGGPGGAVCAIELARLGRRVLLLEATFPPRYAVGESLSPTAGTVLESVGVDLSHAGFVAKRGATFAWGDRPPFRVRYAGADAWQVRRPEMDAALLDRAREVGVDVRLGHRVERVLFVGDRAVGVRMRAHAGGLSEVRAAWVVDATGPAALLARQFGARGQETGSRLAWAQWRGAGRLPGDAAGDSLFTADRGRACWYLPIDDRDDTVIVGTVVADGPPLAPAYRAGVAAAPVVAGLLAGAIQRGPVRTAVAAAWTSGSIAGPGWLTVGDAAGFIDPILTPGVQHAVEFAVLAAEAIDAALAAGPDGRTRDYARRLSGLLDTYRWLSGNLYAAAAGPARPGAPDGGDEQADRLTFLSVIAGIPAPRLAVQLGEYMGMRAAATAYGGAPPRFGEAEGFAFLTWLGRGAAGGPSPDPFPDAVFRMAADLTDEDAGPPPTTRAVRTGDGTRFLRTGEIEKLRAVLADGPLGVAEIAERFATRYGSGIERAELHRWLGLLVRHGVAECRPAPIGAGRVSTEKRG